MGSITASCILVGGVDEANRIWIFKEFYQPRALLGDIARTAGEWTREVLRKPYVIGTKTDDTRFKFDLPLPGSSRRVSWRELVTP